MPTTGTSTVCRRMTTESIYDRLAAEFDVTFTDVRGGVSLTYISGEQVASRLNEVLGVGGWSYRVIAHGINTDADEAWVMGEIMADIDGKTVTRQQFGSQKLKRSRSSGVVMDLGFDLKGAATDAMKKCASLLGVGLYLSRKETPQRASAPRKRQAASESDDGPEPTFTCSQCGMRLAPISFKDGSEWSVARLADYGKENYRRVLCYAHLKALHEHSTTQPLEKA